MKSLLFILLFLSSVTCLGQVSHIEILAGMSQDKVRQYLKLLIDESSNKSLEIEEDITPNGNLVLKVDFPTTEEIKINALSLTFIFQRFSPELEVCITQLVFGSTKHAYRNLSYVKDNFKAIGDNMWEKPFEQLRDSFKINAQFIKEENTYGLIYRFQELRR